MLSLIIAIYTLPYSLLSDQWESIGINMINTLWYTSYIIAQQAVHVQGQWRGGGASCERVFCACAAAMYIRCQFLLSRSGCSDTDLPFDGAGSIAPSWQKQPRSMFPVKEKSVISRLCGLFGGGCLHHSWTPCHIIHPVISILSRCGCSGHTTNAFKGFSVFPATNSVVTLESDIVIYIFISMLEGADQCTKISIVWLTLCSNYAVTCSVFTILVHLQSCSEWMNSFNLISFQNKQIHTGGCWPFSV